MTASQFLGSRAFFSWFLTQPEFSLFLSSLAASFIDSRTALLCSTCVPLSAVRSSYFGPLKKWFHYVYECDGNGRERYICYRSACSCVLGIRKQVQPVGDMMGGL